jgi:hypothetical protein
VKNFAVLRAEERNEWMRTRRARFNPGVSSKETARRLLQLAGLLVSVGVLFLATATPAFSQQASQATSIPHVKCVIGLENIKPNVKGTLSLLPNGLEFATGKNKVEISTASIQDIFTGQESRQDVSGPAGTLAKSAIPYGGGRIVSLFSHNVEVLTVEYVDSNGGFHGTVFVLSTGNATMVKNQLVAQGAKVSNHVQPPPQEQKP